MNDPTFPARAARCSTRAISEAAPSSPCGAASPVAQDGKCVARIVEAADEVFMQRLRQLDYGHTLDRDLAQDDNAPLRLAETYLRHAKDDSTLRVGGRNWRAIAIRHAAQSAAMLFAFIEVQLERQRQEALEDKLDTQGEESSCET
tara:strand:+ start:1390 stop:1827 length:438 start_codon:yes stop_codon:yes gene_type:complete